MTLPTCIRVIEPRTIRYCMFCAGEIGERQRYYAFDVWLDGEGEPQLDWSIHSSCFERGKFIIEGGFVVGWDCHCCTCEDSDWGFSLDYSCRNHGSGERGCVKHRQPEGDLE